MSTSDFGKFVTKTMATTVLDCVDGLASHPTHWVTQLAKDGSLEALTAMPASKKTALGAAASELVTTLIVFKDVVNYDKSVWTTMAEASTGATLLSQGPALQGFRVFISDSFKVNQQEQMDKIKAAALNTVIASTSALKKAKEKAAESWNKCKVIDEKVPLWDFQVLDWLFKGDKETDDLASKMQSCQGLS